MKISINGLRIETQTGETILDAAIRNGIEIPTLCHFPGGQYLPSCGVCVVKARTGTSSRLVPACDSRVQDGMVVETDTAEVREARETALSLLVSEHIGECLAPCETACPAGIDVPGFLREVRKGSIEEAHRVLLQSTPFPAFLSAVCRRYCEKVCRRKFLDEPISIADLKIQVAEKSQETPLKYIEFNGKSVAVVGSGLAGLTSAWFLAVAGCKVVLFGERKDAELEVPDEMRRVVNSEIARVMSLIDEQQLSMPDVQTLRKEFDAVVSVSSDVSDDSGENLFVIQMGNKKLFPPQLTSRARETAWSVLRYFSENLNVEKKLVEIRTVQYDEPSLKAKDRSPKHVSTSGGSAGDCETEAQRCLDCDCSKKLSCKLRILATDYDVDVKKASTGKGKCEIDAEHPDVVFEPGKCIKCGRCISIKDIDKLTFAYRGYNVKVTAALTGKMSDFGQEAMELVKVCPTGAFAMKER